MRRGFLVLATLTVTAAVAAVALAGTGKVSFLGTQTNGSDGVSGIAAPDDVAVSPDGESVYVVGEVSQSIATFDRKANGKLSFVNAKTDGSGGVSGLEGPVDVAVSPDSRNVYVTSSSGDSLVTFQRSKRTGKLIFVNAKTQGNGGVDGLDGAYSLAITPDGHNVLVGSEDSSVASFSRDPKNGKLSFVNAKFDGSGGVSGIEDVTGVAASATNLYAVGNSSSSIATFEITGKKGRLSFVNSKVDGSGGVTNLGNPYDLDVSQDGRNVYVAVDNPDSAIVIFKRSRKTGKLSYVSAKVDGAGGVSDMYRPLDVAASRDGRNVYVAAYQGGTASSLVTFKRNSKKGKLTFLGAKSDGLTGVDADGLWRVAITKDGKNLYTANYDGSSTSAFERDR